MCVRELNISPSEAWGMDWVEIQHLIIDRLKDDIDCSLMLRAEREINGASRKWLLDRAKQPY